MKTTDLKHGKKETNTTIFNVSDALGGPWIVLAKKISLAKKPRKSLMPYETQKE